MSGEGFLANVDGHSSRTCGRRPSRWTLAVMAEGLARRSISGEIGRYWAGVTVMRDGRSW